jgi:hypothetical protein
MFFTMGYLMDLFEFAGRYPDRPGYKEAGTSKDAAKAVASAAPGLRDRVFEAIGYSGAEGLTADQAASQLAYSVLAIRPRVAELAKAGKIIKTGERRANASGLKAAVWRVP